MKILWATGITYAIVATYLLVTWWMPTVFTFVKGMFENSDLGTLMGLVTAWVTVGGYIMVSLLIGFGLVFLVAALLDKNDARKRRQRANPRNR